MKKFLFLFLCLIQLNPSELFAQKDSTFKKNVLYVEAVGGGLAYSINYEYRLWLADYKSISFRIGSNFLGTNTDPIGNKIPFLGGIIGVNHFKKIERKYWTMGISHFFLNGYHSDHKIPFKGIEHYTYLNTGVMWDKPEKKTDLRLNVGIITDYSVIYPWGALSFGFKF